MKENKKIMIIENIKFDPLKSLLSENQINPWYHFSIDDVFECLIEVTDKNIPLFDHPMFSLLKDLHDKYGIRVGLNLFFQKEINGKVRTLKEVRDLKEEIISSGGWLYFGPHALDFDNSPFNQNKEEQIKTFDMIYDEIDRIAGKETYEKWVRLHFYSESYELATYFKERGVEALFSTDRPAGSHRMPEEIKNNLIQNGCATYEGMNFIRTQFRVEFLTETNPSIEDLEKTFKESLEKFGYIILYTHEYEFLRKEICDTLERSVEALNNLSIFSLKKI